MAAPTRSAMVSNVRLYIEDTNARTYPSLTDAQITSFINLGLMWWYENYEKRIKYVTFVADWDNGVYQKDGDDTCIYPEILDVSLSIGSFGDSPLRRMGWTELRDRQASGNVAAGTPVHFAALKYGGAAVTAGLQNLWKFALLPVPDANNNVLRGLARDYPVALSADADVVDLGDYEARCVEIIAAIFAAPRCGSPALAQDLVALLPQMVQAKLQTHMRRDEVNA